MSKIFGTLTAVLLAFSAFIFMKNKDAKEHEDKTYETSQTVEANTKKELKKQVKRHGDADRAREEKVAATEGMQTELEDLTVRYEAAKKEVVALKADHAAKEAEIASANESLKGLPDPTELVPKIKRMRSELVESDDAIATEEAQLVNLAQRDKSGKSQIKRSRETISLYSAGKSFPTLKTSISSIYRNWGFVILSAGDRQGVVTDSVLDVVRGGEVIAKLRVTSVEAGRASADIVLDSVADGTTLHAGDSVVAETVVEDPSVVTAANVVK